MNRIRIPRPFAAIAFAAAVACSSDPIVLCACLMPRPSVTLYGTVTDPDGLAVDGATVHVTVGPPGCGTVAASENEPTDAGGWYSFPVFGTGNYAEQCVRVWAMGPVGSSWRGSDTVRLTLPTPQTSAADSVRRDLVLRAQ